MTTRIKGQQGFTLIELMIVVTIVGMLAAIAIPNFLTYQAKDKQAEAKIALGDLYTRAILLLNAQNGSYVAPTIVALEYVVAGTPRYSYWYGVNGTPRRFPAVAPRWLPAM